MILKSKLALYFGYGSGGHFLRDKSKQFETINPQAEYFTFPWSIQLMDAGLLLNGEIPDDPDGKVYWTCGGKEEFWFAFYWWDRSGDSRGGSNSGFYVRGFTVNDKPEEAFAYACDQWPEIIARQKYPLVLTDGTNKLTMIEV